MLNKQPPKEIIYIRQPYNIADSAKIELEIISFAKAFFNVRSKLK